jgi:hypothetical protein
VSAIKISIGGRLDRSFRDSFIEARRLSREAANSVAKDWANRGALARGGQNAELVAARAIHAEQSRLNRDILKQQVAAAKQADAEGRRLARERARIELQAIRTRQREERQAQREREREERRIAAAAQMLDRQRSKALYRQYTGRDREIDRFATRSSQRATRFIFPRPAGVIGYAQRTASDLMRGVGVDISFAGGVSRAKELEDVSEQLSRNAWQPGQAGPAGMRVAGTTLAEEARAVAGRYGTKGGSLAVAEGRARFVSSTGDLESARAVTEDLAKLSAATGASFEDAMEAAAAISNKLGDVPDKSKKIYELMRGFAWQGKLGAVEISDMARNMPRLLSGVTRFEGDLAENMTKLGALAQMARGGPASSAREAATGVARMADLFVTPQRVKAMESIGLAKSDIFSKTGFVRNPFEIIKKALVLTKGEALPMRTAFASVMGSRPIDKLTDIYRKVGGGKKGLADVDAEIKRLTSGAGVGMSENIVNQMVAENSQTKAARAQRFQENLDRVTASMADRLVPALEQLAPMALRIATAFGNFVSWASENPGKAISLAISLAVGRALTESFMRGLFERVIKRSIGGGGAAGAVGGVGGVGGGAAGGGFIRNGPGLAGVLRNTTLGGALSAAGVGVGIGLGVYSAIDYGGKSAFNEGVKTTGDISKGLRDVHGADLGFALVEAENKLKKYQDDKGVVGGAGSWAMNLFGAGDEAEVKGLQKLIERKREEYDKFRVTGDLSEGDRAEIESRKQLENFGYGKQGEMDYAALAKATTDGLRGNTLDVRVTNAADLVKGGAGEGPSVDPNGRSGPNR